MVIGKVAELQTEKKGQEEMVRIIEGLHSKDNQLELVQYNTYFQH